MIHFSEFEKGLLKELGKSDRIIISFNIIIQGTNLFKDKGLALREIKNGGKTSTVLYRRALKDFGVLSDGFKNIAIPFEIQNLYNYLLKERLIVKIDD